MATCYDTEFPPLIAEADDSIGYDVPLFEVNITFPVTGDEARQILQLLAEWGYDVSFDDFHGGGVAAIEQIERRHAARKLYADHPGEFP